MYKTIKLEMNCKVESEYDVIVCGGGPAGFSAAIQAARASARVAIIEQNGYFGGTGTVNGVNVFSYGYHDGERFILAGMFKEIYDKLLKRDAIIPHIQRAWEPYNMEEYKLLIEELLEKEGVDIYLESSIVAVKMENRKISHVFINTLKGCLALGAKVFVDATGDGYLSFLANVPFDIGREGDGSIQPYTQMFFVGGVDFEKLKEYNRDNISHNEDGRTFINSNRFIDFIAKANDDGYDFIPVKTIGSMYSIPWLPGICGVNFGRVFGDVNFDPKQLAKDSHTGRLQVKEAVKVLQKYIPGFENCYLIDTSSKIGRRESRRIKGLYTLTADDIKNCSQFADVICQACYHIDIHDPKGAFNGVYRLKKGTHYDIPFRCLVPVGVDNLLVAGRCVSASHEALGAIRVQPICMVMGQAAGIAAALCANNNVAPKELKYSLLKEQLIQTNAILE